MPAVEAAIEEARNNIENIKNNSENPTFENTIEALETASESLGTVCGVFYNQMSCAGTDGIQELAEQIGPINANFSSDILLDDKLFERVKTVYDQRETLNLTTEGATLLEDTYIGFVRSGALLSEDGKIKIRELNEQMSTLGPIFMNNTKKATEAFELILETDEETAGIPEMALNGAKAMAEEKGYKDQYLFTLDFPSYMPVIAYADNREVREKIWYAMSSRCYKDDFDNQELIKQIVTLRNQRAKLLGYENHAAYVLERRMAEKPETVWNFLNKLKDTYIDSAKEDLKTLQAYANKRDGIEDLKPWDVAYFSEKLKEETFHFSSEELRPYFKLENVLEGCFEHFSKLFNIRFEEASEKYVTWHKDVFTYEVYDNEDNSFLGNLYADFYPRTGKKTGAWKTSYRDPGLYEGKIERPVVSIVCNFTKPAGDTPSLITFDEVETLFHEMGHAMHCMLGKGTYSSQTGTNVKWDFVELPSQLMENWCCEKETLDLFAKHYETGEPIPQDLIDKLVASKNFMAGWGGLRQVTFGIMDMAFHTTDPGTIQDVAAFEDLATEECRLFERLAGPACTAFNHIFAGGYSAGYYSYKWAEVLDADAFELFKEQGLYNQKVAHKYRKELLERGGTEHPATLYKNFRGKDADPDALLRREGLL